MNLNYKSFWSLFAFCCLVGISRGNPAPGHLLCEDMDQPLGIDANPPRLSWTLSSTDRDEMQSAYQIVVASTLKKLKADQGDLWDSGRVASSQSIQVPFGGQPLTSRELCFWKVRVWDDRGRVSDWSAPATWSMGILNPGDWGSAQWIGLDGIVATNYLTGAQWIWAPGQPELNQTSTVCYFRHEVTLPANRIIKSAYFQYTGDNEGRGWINHFDLGARNNHHTVKFNDITTRLVPGQTLVFGLTGTYHGGPEPAGVVGLLKINFTEGPPLLIPTDKTWLVSTNEQTGWLDTGFDDSHWASAVELGAAGAEPWGAIRSAEPRTLAARYLRTEFVVSQPLARATVYYSGLGLSELHVNGHKVGVRVLSPAFAQYNKRDFYVAEDVTKRLRPGTNAMGVILGNGRFFADRSQVYSGTANFGFPKLLLQLHLEYSNGRTEDIVSDPTWQLTTNGPIVANNDYDGEEYDARKELSGWDKPGYAADSWQEAQKVSAPGGQISAQNMEPIRVTGMIKPVSMRELKPGVYIYDLGQNMVGWCRLRVKGPAGTRVTLRHAETLYPDGSLYLANLRGARATDTYILKGNGTETWEPRFTSHGFRFVEMTGYPGRPTLSALEGCVVNDDLQTNGTFECSNELLNQIYKAIVWGTRGNYRSMPTDCPQRDERQGWLGDRSEESRGETFLFDNSDLYAKWLQDMADAQRPNGSVPDVAPAFWPIYSDNVVWPSSSIIIPSMLLDQFDDQRTIAVHYASMKAWMGHMMQYMKGGLISKDSYGDWCVPPESPTEIHSHDPALNTDKTLLATSYFYHDCLLMAKYAGMLGKTGDQRAFENQASEIKAAFNQKFLDRDRGQYSNDTQTSCVLPLAFGLVPQDYRARVFQHLVDDMQFKTHGHIGTGLVGGQYLCRVLTDGGRPDLVYTIATQTNYPGWGYMMEHGATTIWELWNGNTADPTMNSGNHVMLIGDFVVWLYEDLAGIRSDSQQPGFKHIIMRPEPVGDLTHVSATHRSPYGLISSQWHRNGNAFDWHIQIPPNTTATVYVPARSMESVRSGADIPKGFENSRAVFELGSGCHHFKSILDKP